MMQKESPSVVDGGVIVIGDASPDHSGLDLQDWSNSKLLDFLQHPATRNKLAPKVFISVVFYYK